MLPAAIAAMFLLFYIDNVTRTPYNGVVTDLGDGNGNLMDRDHRTELFV